MEVGEEGDCIPIATISPKMGSNEGHFNVSLIVRDKVTRPATRNQNLFEEKGESKRNRARLQLSGTRLFQSVILPLSVLENLP